MNNNIKILHHIIYNDRDYNTGNLILIFMDGDIVVEVVATPFVRDINLCDILNRYRLDGFSSN